MASVNKDNTQLRLYEVNNEVKNSKSSHSAVTTLPPHYCLYFTPRIIILLVRKLCHPIGVRTLSSYWCKNTVILLVDQLQARVDMGGGCLGALSADATRQLDVLRHDRHSLSVDRTQVCILKQTDQVRLAGFL
jgi:hypothetical protein